MIGIGTVIIDITSTGKLSTTTGTTPPIATIEYTMNIKFDDTSLFLPSKQDVDLLIQTALSRPSSQTLITSLNEDLSSTSTTNNNPLASTISVEYERQDAITDLW